MSPEADRESEHRKPTKAEAEIVTAVLDAIEAQFGYGIALSEEKSKELQTYNEGVSAALEAAVEALRSLGFGIEAKS
jgi:hypothetical protein